MPPKQRITREMILEKSFAMFCREGMDAVNARSVAKALNCSTQPIFSYFAGMDDLKNSLDQRARDVYEQAINEALAQALTIESCCAAYVRFAYEQPQLFAHLFLHVEDSASAFSLSTVLREPLLQAEAERTGLSPEQSGRVCVDTWLYTHGLAATQAAKRDFYPLEEVEGMIARVYEAGLMRERAQQG